RRRPRVLTAIISLVSVLITLEVCTRLFRPDFEPVTRLDPELGLSLKPGMFRSYFDSEAGRSIQMRTNSLGLRGPEYTVTKPPGVRRIAVFGDSFTEARSFDERETFCGRLQSLLNADRTGTSLRWEVMNAGSSGYGTSAELALYRQKIRAYQPDIVIVCFCPSSDVRDNSAELNRDPVVRSRLDEQGRVELVPPPAESVKSDPKNWSQLYRWQQQKIKTLVEKFRTRAEKPEDKVVQITLVPPPAPIERAWDLTSKLLRKFRTEVESEGAEFLVVTIPQCWQIQPDQFEIMCLQAVSSDSVSVDYPVHRLIGICDEQTISLLDLTESFRAAYPYQDSSRSDEWLFLNGRGHLNARGHDLVAAEIFRFLSSRESLEPRAAGKLARNPHERARVR
ncbi:MAG TPA: SGNH/GDSL hydrolase family protein, partial [Planctomycetaceae bacterium]|nr:SGNH/GDSL hydrolase family protein [Planctomycetaceae bacterium]